MAAYHVLHAQGQTDGDHRGQALRHRGDGQADRGHEKLHQLVTEGVEVAYEADLEQNGQFGVADEAQNEDNRADSQGEQAEHLAQFREFALQGGGFVFALLEHLRNPADLRPHARVRDHARAPAVGDDGAHEARVFSVAQGGVLFQNRVDRLLHRQGLSGERGFLHLQVHGFQ